MEFLRAPGTAWRVARRKASTTARRSSSPCTSPYPNTPNPTNPRNANPTPQSQYQFQQVLEKNNVKFDSKGTGTSTWVSLLTGLLPILLLVGFWIFLMNQMQGGGSRVMSFGKSRAKRMSVDSPKVTFKDVAGADEAVEELHHLLTTYAGRPTPITRVERFAPGNEHRLLVVGNRLIAAACGEAASVVGDGVRTIRQLVTEELNSDPRRGEGEACPLSPVEFDAMNLMVRGDALTLIDFQDAVAGPPSYDLISLLRGRYRRFDAATFAAFFPGCFISARVRLPGKASVSSISGTSSSCQKLSSIITPSGSWMKTC